MVDAQAFVEKKKSSVPAYKRIKKVLEATLNGRPSRVVVACDNPQTDGAGESICDKTREIAIQDLHQVLRCIPCQKRSVQIYRNNLAKKRRAELAKHRAKK